MNTKYSVDVWAQAQKAELRELALNLIPWEFAKDMDLSQVAAWSALFARAGFAEYDETIKEHLFGVRGAGVSVGTFVRVAERLWFEAVDDDGFWCSDLTALKLWHWRSLYVNFSKSCSGPADFNKDFLANKGNELAAKIIGESCCRCVFRGLLSLGRLYIP